MHNNQHNWHYPAPHGKRLIAFFIDSVISQVALNLISGFLQMQLPGFLGGIFASLYFTIFHSQFGWTPGKKLMGLEIISLQTKEKPSFGQALRREWFGRFLNLLTMGIGYFMIFFNDSHEGLHDRVCRTQVVTDQASEQSSALPWILGSFTTLAALIGFGVYSLFYTDMPLKHYAKMMEARGVRIDGIKGNLATGFTLGSLSYTAEGIEVLGENLAFTYQDIFRMFSRHEIRIQNIGISKLDLSLSPSKYKKQNQSGASEEIDRPEKKTAGAAAGEHVPLTFVIERVDINQVRLVYEEKEITQIQRFFISEVEINSEKGTIDRIWLDSKQVLFDAKNITATQNEITLSNSNLIVKKELKPEMLQGDVDIQLNHARYDVTTKSYGVEIEGLHKSLKGKLSKDHLELTATNLQPHWYLKNFPPAHTFNLQTKSGFLEMMMAPQIQGSYIIGGQVFNLVPPMRFGEILPAMATRNGKRIQARFVYKGTAEAPFKITLESPEIPDMEGLLSQIYFSKDRAALSPAQLMSLDQKRNHFDLAQAAVLPAMGGLPMAMPPSFRVPAQAMPAGLNVPARVPTVLPVK